MKKLKTIWTNFLIWRCRYKTVMDWKDDLIWCPSQCFKHIEYQGRHFVIYLRWRYSDPWTADLVECDPDGEFEMFSGHEWVSLPVSHWKDTELGNLQREVDYHVKKCLIDM